VSIIEISPKLFGSVIVDPFLGEALELR